MKNLLLIVATIVLTISCHKQELSEIVSGQVVDKGNGLPLAGAMVICERSEWPNGEEVFLEEEILISDAQGRFSFQRSEGHEYIRAEYDDYRPGDEGRIPISPLSEVKVELAADAWLRIKIMNGGDSSPDDRVALFPEFLDQNLLPIVFEGDEVNEELTGRVTAHQPWRIRWRTIIDNEATLYEDYIVCPMLDTTTYILVY